MLILPIKKKWFDMILSGEKKEEYREIKPFYNSRLPVEFGMFLVNGELVKGKLIVNGKTVNEKSDMGTREIMFRNGYSSSSPLFIANVSLSIGTGREEWGAEPGKEYYVLRILEVVMWTRGIT